MGTHGCRQCCRPLLVYQAVVGANRVGSQAVRSTDAKAPYRHPFRLADVSDSSARLCFREWVTAHVDQPVHIRWENWASKFERSGRLVGWFWSQVVVEIETRDDGTKAAPEEHRCAASEIVATLEGIGAPHQLGLGQVLHAAEQELGIELRADDPKKITTIAVGDDRRDCGLGAEFSISYDDPSEPAEHDDRPCPIHDEPNWRTWKMS